MWGFSRYSFVAFFLFFIAFSLNSTPQLTVFIHGTVASVLQMINLKEIVSGAFCADHKGFKLSEKFREDSLNGQEQIMFSQGLVHVPEKNLSEYRLGLLSEEECKKAAYHIIGAYDDMARFYTPNADLQYAAFGWMGHLTAKCRQSAACELYCALIDYRDACIIQNGCEPEINLVGHSHGGTVALYLAEAEALYQKHLKINLVCMLGTPMHKEIAPFIHDDMFKNIVLISSAGDFVQAYDKFSTGEHKSYCKMSDIVDLSAISQQNLGLSRADIIVQVHDAPRRVDHVNLWFLEKSTKIIDALDVFPFVVLVPSLIHAHNMQSTAILLRACIHECPNKKASIRFAFCADGFFKHFFSQMSVDQILEEARARTLATWHPLERSRHIVLNKKNIAVLKNIIK
ncbi:MAG: hypothetical protein WC707_03705 [Candidatus Babeliaceae bacterium]|jgi:hypothetical protein